MIGRRYSDKHIQKDIKLWPFEVINKDGKPYVKVAYKGEDKTFAPEEISAMILTKMKNVAKHIWVRKYRTLWLQYLRTLMIRNAVRLKTLV